MLTVFTSAPLPRSPVTPLPRSPVLSFSRSPVLPFPRSPVPPFFRSPLLPFPRSPVPPFSRSLLPVLRSRFFVIHFHSRSPFSVLLSSLQVYRSLFLVPRSSFLVLRSLLEYHPTTAMMQQWSVQTAIFEDILVP